MKLTDALTHLLITVLLSLCYALSFEAVKILSNPVQALLGLASPQASLLFFPHGVRVVAAYLFGWRSVAYLFPVKLCYATLVFPEAELAAQAVTALTAQAGCVLAFVCMAKLGVIARDWTSTMMPWKSLLLCGCTAAAFNALLVFLLSNYSSFAIAKHFIGDIAGLVSVVVILMAGFRAWRLRA
jgi:hypothetical protein